MAKGRDPCISSSVCLPPKPLRLRTCRGYTCMKLVDGGERIQPSHCIVLSFFFLTPARHWPAATKCPEHQHMNVCPTGIC